MAMENPVSPVDAPTQNFSYPKGRVSGGDGYGNGNEGLDLAGNPVGGKKSGGTLDNLKAAAVGIHVSTISVITIIVYSDLHTSKASIKY